MIIGQSGPRMEEKCSRSGTKASSGRFSMNMATFLVIIVGSRCSLDVSNVVFLARMRVVVGPSSAVCTGVACTLAAAVCAKVFVWRAKWLS